MAPAPIFPLMLPLILFLMPRDEESFTTPKTPEGATDIERTININVAGPTVHVGAYQEDTHGAQANTTNASQQIALTYTQVQSTLLNQITAALEKQGSNLTELDQDLQSGVPKSRQRRTVIRSPFNREFSRPIRNYPMWHRLEMLRDRQNQLNLTITPPTIYGLNTTSQEKEISNLLKPLNLTTMPSLTPCGKHNHGRQLSVRRKCDILCVRVPCPCTRRLPRGPPYYAINLRGLTISYQWTPYQYHEAAF